ncbi:MAG: excinuclease ABC subunit UvrC [Deltaproteobacteria bacterium]|nr:excinuclease ABC subunit UvrC [Deltaproteobacteria bacterium]
MGCEKDQSRTRFRPADYPETPGVYLMKDDRSRVIYVGKAKNLRRRLASYFRQADTLSPKTRVMMARVAAIDTLMTATEKEALLLEASLIKKNRPRYNIVLRDDKNYVLFTLDASSAYPRLTLTRRYVDDGSVYFGPFTSALAARQTMKAVNRIFPLRKCRDHVFRNRVRPCLQYHIGRCLGPCVLDVDREGYAALVRRVEMLLSGRSRELIRVLRSEMQAAAEALEFEKAATLRDQIRAVQETVERQAAVLPGGDDVDVVEISPHDDGIRLGMAFVRQGRLMDGRGFVWDGVTPEDETQIRDMLSTFLVQFYGPGKFIPPRIVLPLALDDEGLIEHLSERSGKAVRLDPARGDHERELVAIARTNAMNQPKLQHVDSPLAGVAARLGLASTPARIEAVDISHLGGRETRAGLVVFEDGRPKREDFRLYNLDGDDCGGDDYKALAAFVRRRLGSGPPWPDLLLIDGGRAQLGAVSRVLGETGVVFPLAAMAKGETRRGGELGDRVFVPGRKNPVAFRPGSPGLLFLQGVRDAAHRFVLTGQRRARTKPALASRVEALPGIGPKTAALLWERFGSVEAMLAAGIEDVSGLPGFGERRASKVVEALAGLREGA